MNIAMNVPDQGSRLQRFKDATTSEHGRLDQRIMDGRPFESRERYGMFLRVQYGFHATVDSAYQDRRLNALIPDLAQRARLSDVERDLADLGIVPALLPAAPAFDLPEALGWLYVAEGSNLGGAFLFKEAAKLGLDEAFGARHLAPHPEGRGLNWRRFKADVDAIQLTGEEDARAMAGARQAFHYVHELVTSIF
ncbi:biliverdin-producing heme oxygenase [Terrihabitans rhizophilus]|uniref:Biliverdin-producing heme oxygenase n=1 Tax=Terrihabitans rhizophilus TaxID=3092662 RepID=A0ABU4RRB5_9HYPH|nr:biliverdin-producing heme oxygenase [Terrihabitans sp. PJ23]MDX6806175.1 biliverdin-producing heme oxygenase [Terrihabitans sp. PJ23]